MDCPVCYEPQSFLLLTCQDQICGECIEKILEYGGLCPICNCKTQPVEFEPKDPVQLDIPELSIQECPDISDPNLESEYQKYLNHLQEYQKEIKNYRKQCERYKEARQRILNSAAQGQITTFHLDPPKPPPIRSFTMIDNKLVVNRLKLVMVSANQNELGLSDEDQALMDPPQRLLIDRRKHTVNGIPFPNKEQMLMGESLYHYTTYGQNVGFYNSKIFELYEVTDTLTLRKSFPGEWAGTCFFTDNYLIHTRASLLEIMSLISGETVYRCHPDGEIDNAVEIGNRLYLNEMVNRVDIWRTFVFE